MARPRRDLEPTTPATSPREFRRLRVLLMAAEPNTPAAALAATVRERADAIWNDRSGGPTAEAPDWALEELWAEIDALGLRESAERHLETRNERSSTT